MSTLSLPKSSQSLKSNQSSSPRGRRPSVDIRLPAHLLPGISRAYSQDSSCGFRSPRGVTPSPTPGFRSPPQAWHGNSSELLSPGAWALSPGASPRGSFSGATSSVLKRSRWQERRPSIQSLGSDGIAAGKEKISHVIKSQSQVRDGSEVYSATIIVSAIAVAACCGVAGFCLHLSVFFSGCLGGLNGCHKSVVLDALEPLGISKSLFFIIASGCSGLLCSCILYAPWKRGIARNCLGGGAAGTKLMISAGHHVSGWIVVLRIILAGLYLGGGNTLGTEGPVIHLGAALATFLTSRAAKSRKILSMFGVIGASAGISAGFSVLITGFIYTTEEITRTLSRRLALILTLAAGVAFLVKDMLERALEHWLHIDHVSLVPHREVLDELTTSEIFGMLVMCIPIGFVNGVAGWSMIRLSWRIRGFLNETPSEDSSRFRQILFKYFLPKRAHLAIIGVITGSFGAIAYEITGMNGVWGTTIGAIPEAIAHGVSWTDALLLFLMKFLSFALATAGGGPGGMLVPSLVAGGFLGLMFGLLVGGSEAFISASAVAGMGSLFASVMHLPVSGIIIIFELTKSNAVILPVVIANFIASNVACRLPHGEHSFAHLMLEHDPMWEKVGKRDFIETDAQATAADSSIGYGKIQGPHKAVMRQWFSADKDRLRAAFEGWRMLCDTCDLTGADDREDAAKAVLSVCDQIMCMNSEITSMRLAWNAWLIHFKLSSIQSNQHAPANGVSHASTEFDEVMGSDRSDVGRLSFSEEGSNGTSQDVWGSEKSPNIRHPCDSRNGNLGSEKCDLRLEVEEAKVDEALEVTNCVRRLSRGSRGSNKSQPHPFAPNGVVVEEENCATLETKAKLALEELEGILGEKQRVDKVLRFLRRRRSIVSGADEVEDVVLEVELQDLLGTQIDWVKAIPFCRQYMSLEKSIVKANGTIPRRRSKSPSGTIDGVFSESDACEYDEALYKTLENTMSDGTQDATLDDVV